MPFFKWFSKIEKLQDEDCLRKPAPLEPFVFAALKPATAGEKIKSAVGSFVFQNLVPPLLRVCQRIWPNPYVKFLNLAIVTRDVDVRQVLGDAIAFGVPYGPEMTDLGAGTTFALGLDGAGHARQNQIMRDAMKAPEWRYQDDITKVVTLTRAVAESLLENGGGQIDVVTDYITRIAAETAARYFGIEIDDPVAFGEWTLAMSCMLFGDPTGDAKTRQLALNAGTRLRMVLDDAIARSHSNFDRYSDPKNPDQEQESSKRDETIVDRLVALKRARDNTDDPISDGEIRAILLGMITGFVPTNTLAASKMLRELLSRPKVFERAVRHAKAGNRDAMKAIVQEAARFDSALAPGQWRVARTDTTIAPDTTRARTVPQGTVILVSTMTALRDPERFEAPGQFRTDREVWGDLMFGFGPHACLGRHMAIEQITEMFIALLARDGLRCAPGREGKMEFTGAFPVRMEMLYDDPAATQSMFLIVAPARAGVSKYGLDKELAKLGHGANIDSAIRTAFDATGLVHFASISTVLSQRGLDIIIELNVDGSVENAIRTLVAKAESVLRPVLAFSDLGLHDDLADCMKRHLVTLHSKPWGATGLDYFGTGEFSVRAIEKQEKFAKLTEAILAHYLGSKSGQGNRPMRAVTHVRRILGQDRFQALRRPARKLMERAHDEGADTFRIKPSRAKLKLADFSNATYWGALKSFLLAPEGRTVVWPIAAVFLIFGYSLYRIITPPLPGLHMFGQADPWAWLLAQRFDRGLFEHTFWGWSSVLGGTILATVLSLAGLVGLIAAILRIKETRDVPDPAQASSDQIEALGKIEDHPGFAQNHFMALGDFKPGLFRTLIHAFALWGIKMIIIFYYRPGFVVNMGTIHYARWWRLPGTMKSIFFSNYDGSWDSYLEDFITRARWGQTAAWSNWQGFPKTKFLIYDGASDGDRFKRWVRTKQQIVPFWYSRFPHLTTDQIRNNALIHHGIARIQTDSEAREWLRCFGSMPRVENLIETDEVQSVVFRGFRDFKHAICLVLKLPDVADGRLGRWLSKESKQISFGDHQTIGQESDIKLQLEQSGHVQKDEVRENFGGAAFLAFSAAGFGNFCGADGKSDDLTEAFPPAFKLGMARRSRILGDFGAASPETWRWSDAPGFGASAAEAVLMLYAKSPAALAAMAAWHKDLLESHGGEVLASTQCAPAWPDSGQAGMEHFGFRDGISQPVIRGTERFAKGVPQRDIVEPGEFILGYKSNQGYYPPSPLVRAEDDFAGELPVPSGNELSRYPDFGIKKAGVTPHDFGRNGSFIVVRELQQDVDGFNRFAKRKAAEISGRAHSHDAGQVAYHGLARLIGQEPDADWVKAKLMGRWPDGRPLIGNPVRFAPDGPDLSQGNASSSVRAATRQRAEHDNDFTYGVDDPQGLACPFGAHIRRTNPRDSKQPGDPSEQVITNRHRLLRRGRSYTRPGPDGEKGLLFVALCGDLERQFEFVQQTWANSPSFHGLTEEPDPIVGSGQGQKTGNPASFTIPTPAGPVKLHGMERFVTARAGGYFFLPSRSALSFLTTMAFKGAAKPS